MKKLFSIFLIFSFFYLMPTGIFAQEDVSVSVQNADESSAIDVKILNVVSMKGEVLMELEVANNTDEFIDTLNYNAELYQGDSLQDVGYVFESVEYVYTGEGNFSTLNPREIKTVSTTFSIPENLEEDTYFLRLALFTKDSENVAMAFTEDSFLISGNGGYLGAFFANVNVEGKKYNLLDGPSFPQSTKQYLEIPFEFNKELESYLSSGKELKAQVAISSVSRKEEKSSQSNWIDLKDLIRGNSVLIPIVPENELVSGSYNAEISYINNSDAEIATKSYARIYIEGLGSRIVSIDTSINDLKKGQNLDLVVPVAFGGYTKEEVGTVEATFRFDDVESQTFIKDFIVNPNDGESILKEIDFSDEVMKVSGRVKQIDVVVKNSEGKTLATQNLELNTDTAFGQKTSFIFYLQLLLILIVVILILLGIKRFFPHLLDSHKNTALQLAMLIASSSIVALMLLITTNVSAQFGEVGGVDSTNDAYDSTTSSKTYMDIWTSLSELDKENLSGEGAYLDSNYSTRTTTLENFALPTGDLGSCTTSEKKYPEIYVRMRCPHCLNELPGTVKLMSKLNTENWPNAVKEDFSYDYPTDLLINLVGYHTAAIDGVIQDTDIKITGSPNRQYPNSPQAVTWGPFRLPIGINSEDIVGRAHDEIVNKTYRLWGTTGTFGYCTVPNERVNQHTISCKVDLDVCDNITGVQTGLPLVGEKIKWEDWYANEIGENTEEFFIKNIAGPIVGSDGSSICPATRIEKPTISCSGDTKKNVGELVNMDAVITAEGTNPVVSWTNYSPDEDKFINKEITNNTKKLTYTTNEIGTYSVDVSVTDEYGQVSESKTCEVVVGTEKTPNVSCNVTADEPVWLGDDFTFSVDATSDIGGEMVLNVIPVNFEWNPQYTSTKDKAKTITGSTPLNLTSIHRINTRLSEGDSFPVTMNYEAYYVGNENNKATGSCVVNIKNIPPEEELGKVSCRAKPITVKIGVDGKETLTNFNESFLGDNGIPYVSVSNEQFLTSEKYNGYFILSGKYKEAVFVDWQADVLDGEGPYTYSWSRFTDGSTNTSPDSPNPPNTGNFTDGRMVRTTYDNNKAVSEGVNYELRESRKISRVTVTDKNGLTGTATCAVDVDVKQDICLNMLGIQETLPEGYEMYREYAGAPLQCVKDKCKNMDGIQLEVPFGYVQDENGNCPPPPPPPVTVSCRVQNTTPEINKPITFIADVLEGDGPFDFEWEKADLIQIDAIGRSSSATRTYSEYGKSNDVYVYVYDKNGKNVGSKACEVNIVQKPKPFRVFCSGPEKVEVNQPAVFKARLEYASIYDEYFKNTPISYTWADMWTRSSEVTLSFSKVGIQNVPVVASDELSSPWDSCEVEVIKPPVDDPDLCKNIQKIQTKIPEHPEEYKFEGEDIVRIVPTGGMKIVGENCYPVLDFSTKVSCSAYPSKLPGNGVVTLTPKVSGGVPSIVPKTLDDYDFIWTPQNEINKIEELNNDEKQVDFIIKSAEVDESIEQVDLEVIDKSTGELVGNIASCLVNIVKPDICSNIDGKQVTPDDLPKLPEQPYYYEFEVKKATPKNGFDINADGTCTPRADCDPYKDLFGCKMSSVCVASPTKVSGLGGKVLMTPYVFGWNGNYEDLEVKWFPVDQNNNEIKPIAVSQLNQAYFHIYDNELKNGGKRYAGYEVLDTATGKKVQSSCTIGVDPILDIECHTDKENQKISAGEPVNYTLTAKLGSGTYKYRWIDSGVTGLNILSANTPTSFKTSFTSGGDHIVTGEVEFTNTANYKQLAQFTCPNVEVTQTFDLCQNIDYTQTVVPGPGEKYFVNGIQNIVPPNGLERDSNNICTPTKLELSCTATPNTASIGTGIVFDAKLENEIVESSYSYSYVWSGPTVKGSGRQVSRIINQGDIDYPQTVKVSVYESVAPYRSVGASCPFTITPPVSDFTNQCRSLRIARPNFSIEFVSDTSPDGSYEYKWSGDGVSSEDTNYSSSLKTMTMSFANPGIYNVTSTAKKNGVEVSSVCTVDVRAYTEIDLSCNIKSGADKKYKIGETVTYEAVPSPFSADFEYQFSGSFGVLPLSKSTTQNVSYDKEGDYNKVAVELYNPSTKKWSYVACPSVEVVPGEVVPPFVVACFPNSSKVSYQTPVEFTAYHSAYTGKKPISYLWSSVDSSDGTGKAFKKYTISDVGTKTVNITATDADNKTANGSCSVEICDPAVDNTCPIITPPSFSCEIKSGASKKYKIGETVSYEALASPFSADFTYGFTGAFVTLPLSKNSTGNVSYSKEGNYQAKAELYNPLTDITISAVCPNVEVVIGSCSNDICPNIDGCQETIPGPGEEYFINGVKNSSIDGLEVDEYGQCVPKVPPDFTNQCEVFPRFARPSYPIKLISNTDPDGSYEYKWSGDGVLSEYTNYSSSFESITTSFANPGIYNVVSYAKKGSVEVPSICTVDVRAYPNLDGGCAALPNPVCVKGNNVEEVNWIGTAVGGTGEYTYRWTGAARGTSSSVSAKYTKENIGINTTQFFINDGIQDEIKRECSVEVLDGDTNPLCNPNPSPMVVDCKASPSQVKVGERVDWILTKNSGGLSPYEFDWYFIDSSKKVDGFSKTDGSGAYNTFGIEDVGKTKTVKVNKKDSLGKSESSVCSVKVIPGDTDIVCRHDKENQKINIGDPITYTLDAKLGTGIYKYRWFGWSGASKQGLDVLSENTPKTFTTTFDTAGDHFIFVDVKFESSSGGNLFKTVSCPNIEVNNGPYKRVEASCGATPDPVCVSGTNYVDVDWFGSAIYGKSPYTYEWTFDGVKSEGSSKTKRYTMADLGPHTGFFSAKDGITTGRTSCSIEVLDADHDVRCNPESTKPEVSCKAVTSPIQAGKQVDWIIDEKKCGVAPCTFDWSWVLPGWSATDGSGARSNYPTSEAGNTKYAKVKITDRDGEFDEYVCDVELTAGPTEYSVACKPSEWDYSVNSTNWKTITENRLDVEYGKEVKIKWSATPSGTIPTSSTLKWTLGGIASGSYDNQWQTITAHTLAPKDNKIIPAKFRLTNNSNGDFKEAQCNLRLVAISNTKDVCPNIVGDQDEPPKPGEEYTLVSDGQKYIVPPSGMKIDDDGNCVPVVPFTVECRAYKKPGFTYITSINVKSGEPVTVLWDGRLVDNKPINRVWEWTISGMTSNATQQTASSEYTLGSEETREVFANVKLTDTDTGQYAVDTCSVTLIADGGDGGCDRTQQICDGDPNPVIAGCRIGTTDDLVKVEFGPDKIPYFRAHEDKKTASVALEGEVSPNVSSYTYTYIWKEGSENIAFTKNVIRSFGLGRHDVTIKVTNQTLTPIKDDTSSVCSFFVAPFDCNLLSDPECDEPPGGDSSGGEIKEI